MDLASTITHIGTGSVLGLAGLTILANMFPGIPEEIFLIVLGAVLASTTAFPFWLVYLVVWVSLVFIDNVLYWLSRGGNRIIFSIKKRIFGNSFDKREDFIKRHIVKIVVISRFVIQVRFLGPFLAGAVRMPWKKFQLWNALALALYIPLMLWIGMFFGDRIENVILGVQGAGNAIIIAVLVILCIAALAITHRLFLRWIRSGSTRPLVFLGLMPREKNQSQETKPSDLE